MGCDVFVQTVSAIYTNKHIIYMMNMAICVWYYLIHTTMCVCVGGGAIYNIMGHERRFNC